MWWASGWRPVLVAWRLWCAVGLARVASAGACALQPRLTLRDACFGAAWSLAGTQDNAGPVALARGLALRRPLVVHHVFAIMLMIVMLATVPSAGAHCLALVRRSRQQRRGPTFVSGTRELLAPPLGTARPQPLSWWVASVALHATQTLLAGGAVPDEVHSIYQRWLYVLWGRSWLERGKENWQWSSGS